METESYSRGSASQVRDVGQPSPPYPLTHDAAGLWLRRGERLGRAACRIAAIVAVGFERAARWPRHAASKAPIDTPPQPG